MDNLKTNYKVLLDEETSEIVGGLFLLPTIIFVQIFTYLMKDTYVLIAKNIVNAIDNLFK